MRFLGFQTGLGACAGNPRMAVKSPAQQAVLALPRSRALLVCQRTMAANALRAAFAEFGVVGGKAGRGCAN
jgi:transposase